MQRYIGKGFRGLNDSSDASIIADDEFQDSSNIRINKDKSFQKRGGFVASYTGNTNPVLDLETIKVGYTNYNLYATKSAIGISGTGDTYTGLSGVDHAQFLQFNDKIFMANGQDEIKKTTVLDNDRIYQNVAGVIRVFNSSFVYIEEYDLSATIGTDGYGLVTDGSYFYVCGNDKVWKYTMNFEVVSNVAFTGAQAITYTSTHLFVTGSSNLIKKILKNDMSIVGSVDATTLGTPGGNLDTTTIYSNGTNIFYRLSGGLGKLINSSLSLVNENGGFGTDSLVGIGNAIYFSNSSYPTLLFVSNMTTLGITSVTLTDISLSGKVYSYMGTDLILGNGTSSYVYTTSGVRKAYISGQSNEWSITASSTYYRNNFVTWNDLCSPGKPIQNEVITEGGNIVAGTVTRYRYTGYNVDTQIETSGGAVSSSQTSTGKLNEVFFDFNPATQWEKAKCDDIGVTHWRMYRSDNSASYQYAGIRPIYFTATANEESGGVVPEGPLSSTTGDTLTVLNALGYTYTNNEYIVMGTEYMAITAVSNNVFTVTRGQKGSTAYVHTADEPVYFFSMMDDTASVAMQGDCPLKNEYVDNCKYMASHKSRFVMANSTANPSRLWFSSTLDEDIITEDQYIDVNDQDGDEITGIRVFQDTLFIFKRNSTWYFTGDFDTGVLARLNDSIGCEDQHTIVEWENRLYWLSRAGIMCYYGFIIHNLSHGKCQTYLNTLNWQATKNSFACINPNNQEIIWSVPTSSNTTNNSCLVLNLFHSDLKNFGENSFYTWARTISAMHWIEDTGTSNGYILSGQYDGHIGTESSSTLSDDGVAFDSWIKTKNYNFGFDISKKFRRIWVDHSGTSYTFYFQYRADGMVADSTSVSVSGTGGRVYKELTMKDSSSLSPQGKWVYFKIGNSSTSQSVIYNIMVDHITRKVRGN